MQIRTAPGSGTTVVMHVPMDPATQEQEANPAARVSRDA